MMDAALSRCIALERRRVLDLAAMARAVEAIETGAGLHEAATALLDRLYTHWGGDDDTRDH